MPVSKANLRVAAYGDVDETNACLGLVRLHIDDEPDLDAMLARIQNDLFDLGADLATPEPAEPLAWEPLRVLDSQVTRLEQEIDALNADLAPLTSFVLPAGTPAATAMHLARTVCRRAERSCVALASEKGEVVGAASLMYLNRLSDLLFVASRWLNHKAGGDVLWQPGANRR